MNNASKAARDLLRRYRVMKPSLDTLCSVVSEQGYEIIDFDPKDESIAVLSKELALTPDILSQNAFTYQNKGISLLFVRDNLTAEEKLYVMAHELGHIILGHLKNGNPASVLEEYEADEFTHYLLHPKISNNLLVAILRHKLVTGLIVGITLVAALVGGILGYMSTQSRYTGDLYITPSGQKYHRANCSVIKNSAHSRRMTIDEFESGEYEPCKLCVPDD